jgi:ACS family hexuronate transporter-like MFS transporter
VSLVDIFRHGSYKEHCFFQGACELSEAIKIGGHVSKNSALPKLAWIIAGMLLFSTLINYADRLTLAVLITDIRKHLSLDERDYSQIVSIFLFSYAIMYAASGYIVDRLGTRRGFAVFVFGWSVSQMLHGLAGGKWSLAGCRFLLGATEPGNFPAAVKAIQEWFPAERRALGVGIFNAGSSLGAAIASPMAAFIALRYGWRAPFIFTGGLGLVWLICWLSVYYTPGGAEVERRAPPPSSCWKVFVTRPCVALMLARFFSDPVIYFVNFWLPAYLQKERGYDLAMVGRYAWVPYAFGGIGYLFGGWVSGKLVERGWTTTRARKTIMLAGACLMPAAIATPLAPSAQAAIAAMCVVTFGHAIWIANLLTLPADLFPGSQVGTATGFSGMAGSVGGILANLATGYVISKFTYLPLFVVAGLMHPLAMILVLALLREKSRDCYPNGRVLPRLLTGR